MTGVIASRPNQAHIARKPHTLLSLGLPEPVSVSA